MADWFDDITDFASECIDDVAELCLHSTTKQKSDEELKATEQDFNNCCTTLQNACANLNKIREDSSAVIEYVLDSLEEKWSKKYPAVLKSWSNKREYCSAYFKYPEHTRRIIYTINTV